MKTFVLLTLLSFGISLSVKAQDTAFQQDILHLIEISGSKQVSAQVFDQMVLSFNQSFPDIPEVFWQEMKKEINTNDFIRMLLPIYEKYYTHADIKALIAFYQSPIGKKTVAVLPQITKESMQVGQLWGMEIAEKTMKRLQEEGIIDD